MDILLSGATNLIIFVVMFGLLVFVHELGHFAVAKRLGIPVLEFGFGFPPRARRVYKGSGWIEIQGKRIFIPREFQLPPNLAVNSRVMYKTQNENGRDVLTSIEIVDAESQAFASPVQYFDPGTEYTLNWIPIGGFVRMAGEEDPNVPGGFAAARPIIRAPILLAGVTMNLIVAFVVFVLVAFVAPPYATVQTTSIAAIASNSPAAEAGLKVGDTITAVNGQALRDDYNALRQLLRQNASKATTLTVMRGNRTLDPITVTPRANPPAGEGPLGVALTGWTGLTVSSVAPGSVADQAGVRAGDVLVFLVDPTKGQPLKDQNDLIKFTTEHPNWKVDWHISRGGQLLPTITVQIPEKIDAQNATLGLNLQTGILDAPGRAMQEMGTVVGSIPTMFSQIASGNAPPNSFVGVVGIYQATGEIAQRGGAIALLEFFALLSLNLAVVNLIPFPPLDGARLVFVFLEWIRRGKKIDPSKEGMVNLVGLAVLLGLMVIISFFDVQRLISGQSIFPSP